MEEKIEERYKVLDEKFSLGQLSQVTEVSIVLPFEDKASRLLYHCLLENIIVEKTECEDCTKLGKIPFNDVCNVIIGVLTHCKEHEYSVKIIESMMVTFDSFRNVKKISFVFSNNTEILDMYNKIFDGTFVGDKVKLFSKLFIIDRIEINLASLLSVDIVDMLNENFICNGYLNNDYLNRKFVINFDFDDYYNYMKMVISNNNCFVDKITIDNVNRLLCFPVCISECKPNIDLVTNYSMI